MAAHALADAQVDDRHVVDGLAVEHEHRVGELEVGDRRLQRRARPARGAASSGSAPPARESRSGESRPSRSRRCRRKPSSLVVSPPTMRADAAAWRASSAAAASSSARSQRDRAQLAAVAHHRLRDALVDVDRPGRRSGPCRTASRRRPRRCRAPSTRRTRSSRTVKVTLHCAGHSVQTEPEPSMSHGRARKR